MSIRTSTMTPTSQAKQIAEALKEEGWDFASHTWGHLSVTGKTVDQLRTDNEKWMNNVADIVGATDTIIFAHGNDIGSWEGYSSDNEVYQYFSERRLQFLLQRRRFAALLGTDHRSVCTSGPH
ncbi:MAG: polysaccharide deacetylase family protein [Lachnospiraceae bacterium]